MKRGSNKRDVTAAINAGVMRHIVGAQRVSTKRAAKAAARAKTAPAATAALPAPVQGEGAVRRLAPMHITDTVMSAAATMRTGRKGKKAGASIDKSPFDVYMPPPGVLPDGVQPLAMDEASSVSGQFAAINGWGVDGLSVQGMFEEGIGFLGYSYLALLTQRPEYRRISERIATEMTREWIELQVTSSIDADDEKGEDAPADQDGTREQEPGLARDDVQEEEPSSSSARARKAASSQGAAGEQDAASSSEGEQDGEQPEDGELTPEEEAEKAKAEEKTRKVRQLDDELKRLKIKDLFCNAAEQDGWFGRSHIYIDVDGVAADDSKRAELATSIGTGRNETSAAKVVKGSKLRFRSVEPMWVYPATYEAVNPLKSSWYKPRTWYANGIEVHKTRLLTFVGRNVPDILKPAYAFGGLSMSQMAKPYVDNWLRTRQAVADLIESFSVSGVYTNMAGTLQEGGVEAIKRIEMFNVMRANAGALVLDKETEEFFNVSTPLGTLDHLQAQAQEQMSSVSGIPLVVLLGITPSGLNASSEGEIRVFYDWIRAYQEALFRDHLQTVIEFVQLSLWGEVDPEIGFTFKPLWSMTEKEKGEVDKHEAEADQIRIDSGVLHPEEARKALAAKPGSRYADINVEDVPEPPQPEGEGGDPFGGDGGGEQDSSDHDEGGGGDNPFSGASDEALFEHACALAEDEQWDESKHPRADNGQFGAGSSSSAGKSKSAPATTAKTESKSSAAPLSMASLKKSGGKLGSNEGGVYEAANGDRFYVKKPKTKAHVENELAAARLYQLAGVNTLNYQPIEGGEHVATKWEELDKNNIAKMTPAEKKEAAKDFAVHAWLSNWDAAGTGGDNQGIRGGKPVTLDVGGSLRFRAQGGPKGAAFGPKVTELDTMRNPSMSPDAARLFGKMSDDDLRASVERVASIPDEAIRKAVGNDKELADTLIDRKADMAKRFGVKLAQDEMAADQALLDYVLDQVLESSIEEVAEDVFVMALDEGHFDESKVKRDADGKFSSTGGGGGAAGEAAEVGKAFKTKKEHIAHLLTKGTTPKELMQTMGWPSVSMPAQAQALGMKLEKKDGKYFGVPMTDAEKAEAKAAAAAKKAAKATSPKEPAAPSASPAPAAQKEPPAEPAPVPSASDPDPYSAFLGTVAEKAQQKDTAALKKLFTDHPEHAKTFFAHATEKGKAALAKAGVTQADLEKPTYPKPSPGEAEKAKKGVAVKMAYVPGEKPQGGEFMANAEAAVASFNKKWEGKPPETAEAIAEKVHDFKQLQGVVNGLAAQEKAQTAAQKAAAEKKAAEEKAAKEKAEKERLEKKFAADPDFKLHYEAMTALMGGQSASKAFRDQAAKKLKSSGLEKHLTPEAAMPIIAYSGSHYAKLNDELRKGQMTMDQYKFMKSLNAGLDKLPAYEGTTYRKASLTPEQFALYKPGMVVEERGFTSTSTNKNVWSGSYQYVVHGKSGRDIKKLSKFPNEQEVLFKSGTRFLVESIKGNEITLREV